MEDFFRGLLSSVGVFSLFQRALTWPVIHCIFIVFSWMNELNFWIYACCLCGLYLNFKPLLFLHMKCYNDTNDGSCIWVIVLLDKDIGY